MVILHRSLKNKMMIISDAFIYQETSGFKQAYTDIFIW